MKKLLLAPFVLASLFSFGGELKANPGSRYELPDPRNINNDSLGNQSSNNVWNLIIANTVFRIVKSEGIDPSPYQIQLLKILPTTSNTNCQSLGRNIKSMLKSVDLGGDGGNSNRNWKFKNKTYYKCIKTSSPSISNTYLVIHAKPWQYQTQFNSGFMSNDGSLSSPLAVLNFRNKGECMRYKTTLESWFLQIKNDMTSSFGGKTYEVDTKCLNK